MGSDPAGNTSGSGHRGDPYSEPHGGGKDTCSHRKAVPVWTWDEMIRETADLYVPRDTHSPEVSVCPS